MKRIKEWRLRIAEGQARAVKEEVLAALDELPKREQARAYGLVVACCRDLDQTEEGLLYLAAGQALASRSAAAKVELLAQGASLLIHVGDAERAREYVEDSLSIVEVELGKPTRPTRRGRERRQWFLKAKARNHVLRGDLTFRLKDRPGEEALQDAFAAIEAARGFADEQSYGVSLLGQVLALHGGLPEVQLAFKLTAELDRYFAQTKRLPRSHPYRLFVRWGRAVAFARLGMDERGEAIMTEIAAGFIKLDRPADARMAVQTLLWMIAERSGEIGRARFVAKRYKALLPDITLPTMPRPVKKSIRGW